MCVNSYVMQYSSDVYQLVSYTLPSDVCLMFSLVASCTRWLCEMSTDCRYMWVRLQPVLPARTSRTQAPVIRRHATCVPTSTTCRHRRPHRRQRASARRVFTLSKARPAQVITHTAIPQGPGGAHMPVRKVNAPLWYPGRCGCGTVGRQLSAQLSTHGAADTVNLHTAFLRRLWSSSELTVLAVGNSYG